MYIHFIEENVFDFPMIHIIFSITVGIANFRQLFI